MPEITVPADLLGRVARQLNKLERQTPAHDAPVIIRPLSRAFSMIGVGKTRGYAMIREGLLETVPIGKRGKGVTLASIERLAGARRDHGV